MALVDGSSSPFANLLNQDPVTTQSQHKHIFINLLKSIKHPHLLPILEGTYLRDRQKLVLFREFSSKGSIRDLINRCNPAKKQFEKYHPKVQGEPLSEKDIKKYGSHVLAALDFLKSLNYPAIHIHAGNVIIDDNTALLSDWENTFLGLEPSTACGALPKDSRFTVDAFQVNSFGRLLVEMATGSPLGAQTWQDVLASAPSLKQKLSSPLLSILDSIFTADGVPTVKLSDIMKNSYFTAPGHSDPISLTKKGLGMINSAREHAESMLNPLASPPSSPPSSPKLSRSMSNENMTTKPPSFSLDANAGAEVPKKQKSATMKKSERTSKSATLKKKSGTITVTKSPSTSAAPPPPGPPPPPPPGPPPPPKMDVPAMSNQRSALLDSIRQNNMSKLKKVTTKTKK